MGLISADELKRWLNGFKETDNISPVYMRTLIDSQPTVEAIPVRWIEDYIEERTNVFGDMNVALMLKRWKEGYKPSVPDIGGKENADVC